MFILCILSCSTNEDVWKLTKTDDGRWYDLKDKDNEALISISTKYYDKLTLDIKNEIYELKNNNNVILTLTKKDDNTYSLNNNGVIAVSTNKTITTIVNNNSGTIEMLTNAGNIMELKNDGNTEYIYNYDKGNIANLWNCCNITLLINLGTIETLTNSYSSNIEITNKEGGNITRLSNRYKGNTKLTNYYGASINKIHNCAGGTMIVDNNYKIYEFINCGVISKLTNNNYGNITKLETYIINPIILSNVGIIGTLIITDYDDSGIINEVYDDITYMEIAKGEISSWDFRYGKYQHVNPNAIVYYTIPTSITNGNKDNTNSKSNMSTGAIIGITVGCSACGVIIVLLVVYFMSKYCIERLKFSKPSRTEIVPQI